MRTGFSLLDANDPGRSCIRLARARFAENLREATSEEATRLRGAVGRSIPAEFAPSNENLEQEDMRSTIERMQNTFVEAIKPKLSPSLRNSVPAPLIILSGFSSKDQSFQDLAGCYIRLGANLRELRASTSLNFSRLASISYVNSGLLYATSARLSEDLDRVTSLVSAAECYYWASSNETDTERKLLKKDLAIKYANWARQDANDLGVEDKIIQLADVTKIDMLIAHMS